MALRAGVTCADIEFMQFHPTALLSPRMPRPLLSEALRGHGALIRDLDGKRFVDELQPRDVVARAITRKMLEEDADHMLLDATGLEGFDERFPTITADLRGAGLDPATDYLPIAPAAHYHCGGIVTDLNGASSLPGLWAAGEVACTGVHGANRLASNSLLEGMVFGPRVIEAIGRGVDGPEATGAMRSVIDEGELPLGHGEIGGRKLTVPAPVGSSESAPGRRMAAVGWVGDGAAGRAAAGDDAWCRSAARRAVVDGDRRGRRGDAGRGRRPAGGRTARGAAQPGDGGVGVAGRRARPVRRAAAATPVRTSPTRTRRFASGSSPTGSSAS